MEYDTKYWTVDGTPVKIKFNESADRTRQPMTLELESSQPEMPAEPRGSHAFEDGGPWYPLKKIETPEFPHLPEIPSFKLSDRYKGVRLEIAGDPKTYAGNNLIPTGPLYLFNVIVALEWWPSKRTIDTLMHAFRGASDVLYDATNGGMAFGQVVFGGPEYLERADVQILASNRFHPRSMVNGLTDPKKYSPIRLGRGIWRKDRQILLSWDDVISYRAIAHEWAHYALGLRDEYIDNTLRVVPQGNRLVEEPAWGVPLAVPRVLISQQTLMETLEADELVPFQRTRPAKVKRGSAEADKLRERILNDIGSRYEGIRSDLEANNPGPHGFPLPLPVFFRMNDLKIVDPPKVREPDDTWLEERICEVAKLQLDHCWLYSYAYQPGKDGQPPTLRIIAQGRIDERAKSVRGIRDTEPDGFELLGAREGDALLAIGLILPEELPGTPRPVGKPATQQANLSGDDWGQRQKLAWNPVVAVVPIKTEQEWPNMQVRVVVNDSPTNVWLSLPGDAPKAPIDVKDSQPITHMDGIIALEQIVKDRSSLWVAEFSYGGNPPTSVLSPGAPINAGSSDGNLMIFSALDDEIIDNPAEKSKFYNKPIVTTRNYAGFEDANPGRPAGYLFSVASSDAIDTIHQKPTIVMYYDGRALEDNHDLVIHRYDQATKQWQALPTYLPAGDSYVATPINAATAPSLVESDNPPKDRVEYYRLFSIPR